MGYAALAGAVDAIGFLKSGGLFVSFMTGNSTRLAIGIAEAMSVAITAAALIALFVTGVILNVLASESATIIHRKTAATLVVAMLLVTAAGVDSSGGHLPALGCLCLAMGAANAIFRREGEVGIGVTYMTGTLVKLGHRVANRLRGSDDSPWLPYLLLWLSLVMGGVAGAAGFAWSPKVSLWCAAAASIVLAGVTTRLVRTGDVASG
ncbi:DUF1275 domain-containing protein [Sphingomonas sp. IC-11]|nr:YoaK family protein [Sphingomonas sp. IC-11]MCD2317310.1 DUF1275 domain-containing protein [Sphingomonas sp. IC-11]